VPAEQEETEACFRYYIYIDNKHLKAVVLDHHVEADGLSLARIIEVPVLGGGARVQHVALTHAVCNAAVYTPSQRPLCNPE
jgi:hypothetical protein